MSRLNARLEHKNHRRNMNGLKFSGGRPNSCASSSLRGLSCGIVTTSLSGWAVSEGLSFERGQNTRLGCFNRLFNRNGYRHD